MHEPIEGRSRIGYVVNQSTVDALKKTNKVRKKKEEKGN